jgi:hypothetical protein
MNTVAARVRPSTPVSGASAGASKTSTLPVAIAPTLTKPNARSVEQARAARRFAGDRAYAATLAGIHRSENARQQRAIEAVIAADATAHLFMRHPVNGCLLAREG